MAECRVIITDADITPNPAMAGQEFKISVGINEIFLDYAYDYPYDYTKNKSSRGNE